MDNDRRRRETLLEAAKLLTELRDEFDLVDPINPQLPGHRAERRAEINAMIDRCNLAALPDGWVEYRDGNRDDS